MTSIKIFGIAIIGLLAMSDAALATPINTLTPLVSNGTQMYAVYVFSEAGDTLRLSEIGPNSNSEIFCNKSNFGCTAAAPGQIVDLGVTDPGIVFGLTDLVAPNIFRTDQLASDGFAHDKVSLTVDASDSAAVAAAYAFYGQGALDPAAALSIELLGSVPGTSVTFVGWEDRIGGDFDYNDLIFAFTDPPVPAAVPEPGSLALFAMGLFGVSGLRRRNAKS